MKRIFLIGLIALLVQGCVSQADFGDAITEGEPTPIPTSVIPTRPIYEVERGDIIDQRTYFGRISAINTGELLFTTDGLIITVHVSAGDDVQAGDVIAEIDTSPLESELLDAEEELALAQSLLTTAENQNNFGRRETELRVQLAQIFLDFAELQAETNPSAEADLLVSQHEIELQLAELQLEQLDEGVDPSLVFDVTRAQEEVDRINADIASAVLTAPMSGRITSLLVEEGDPVVAYQTIGIVSDLTELEVTNLISREDSSEMTEGLPALLQRANAPDVVFDASVALLPQPFGSGTDDRVHIQFETQPATGEFEIGERMSFTVTIDERTDVLWLPPGAIRQFSGREFVVIQQDGVERRIDIQIGLEGADRVEIVEGLEEGQRVVAP